MIRSLGAVVLAASVVGCTSATPDSASESQEVSAYEISRELVPLLDAVSTYANTDYSEGSNSPYTPEIYEAVKDTYRQISPAKQRWTRFVDSLDYAEVDIPGLEQAIADYDQALNDWQDVQDDSMQVWDACFEAGGDDMTMSMCLLTGLDAEAERQALDAYISNLKRLFSTLDISIPAS
jgi:hypothetical protein